MFHNIEWTQPVIEKRSACTNKSCAIVIPVYKSKLTQNEIMSFKQVISCLGKEYQIWIIGPENLDTECYTQVSDGYKFNTAFCNSAFFKSTETYSYLCETTEFYEIFKDFTYILIYQLDGWVFENNNLKYFLEGCFDYIGSPWMAGNFDFKRDAVGNGGVSLRKVSKFIELCDSLNKYDFESKWVKLEDLFFCKYVKSIKRNIEFNIADVQTASGFCIDAFHSYFVKMNKGKLPMFAHGWSRPSSYDVFWKKYIPIQKEKNEIKRNMSFNYFNDYFSNNTIGYNLFENAYVTQKEKRKPINITNKKVAAKPADGEKIIVTFTTWKQRINNVPHIIDNIMKNTMLPDKICINLSVEDFPNLESDFSQEVKGKIKQYSEIIEVNWLSNNTKVWKKLIPTLCKYPNDVVISIDDDWEYPNDIIQTLYDDYCKYDKKYPISGNNLTLYNMKCHCGSGSLTTYKLLNSKGQFNTLSEECVSYGSDDIFYTYCAYVNGNEYKQASKMYFTNMIPYRANNAFSTVSNVNIGKALNAAKKSFENNAKTDQLGKICKNVYKHIDVPSSKHLESYANSITKEYMPHFDKLYNEFMKQLENVENDIKSKQYNGEKAIISLTSWKARISYVAKTIFSILMQCPGFHVVLVLSEEEFPNKEKELPNNLLLMLKNKMIEIIWVSKNYKPFKKVLFTLDKYRNIPIISADDDCIYKRNYAELLYQEWLKNPQSIICNAIGNKFGFKWGNGPYTLYPPYCFKHYGINCLNNEILSTNDDDAYYGVLLTKLNISIKEIKQRNLIVFHDEKNALGSNRTPAVVKKDFEIIDKAISFNFKKKINLIGNSCISSYVIRDFVFDEFNNPFCWCIIEYESMYNLVKYYDSLNFMKYTLEFDDERKTYNVIIDNKVTVKYIHYIQDDTINGVTIKNNNVWSNNIKQYVIEKYEERVKKMKSLNIEPVFLIAAGYTQGYYYNDKQLQSIIDLESKYKIIISYDKCNVKPNANTIIMNHPYRMDVNDAHIKIAAYLWNSILGKMLLGKEYFTEILLLTKTRNAKDFNDWVEWHLNKLKFDHITVFDNESTVDIRSICEANPKIDYHFVKGFPDQYKIYNQYINNESKSLWVLPIDDDEYLWMKNFDNVNDMLKYYQLKWTNMHKLSVRWKNMFPNDANAIREEQSLMDFCTNDNEEWAKLLDGGNKPVKTFVCTSQEFLYNIPTRQTHVPISQKTKDQSYMCNGQKISTNWYKGDETDTDLKILHFQYKSKDEWIYKCKNRKRVSSVDTVGYNSKRAEIYKLMK